MRFLRYFWAFPATLVGLAAAFAVLACGGRARRVQGTLEVGGGALARAAAAAPEAMRFGALTLGHVIIGLDEPTLASCRAHERVHVRQYERWGVFFFPVYLASSVWQALRGRDWYRDNRFEREARCAGAQERASKPPVRSTARR